MDNNITKALLSKIEAKYDKAMATLKEKQADAEIEIEKRDLEEKINNLKTQGELEVEKAKAELNTAWDRFEHKFNSLTGQDS